MNENDLRNRLASIEELPALPLVLQQVQKIINNPKSNMAQIAAVMAKDQALSSKTIKLVNSAFYGMSKPVASISQAIVILGLNTVNNLMLGLGVIKVFNVSGLSTLNHNAFWEHSFGSALIARSIAKFVHYEEPEDCFTAGLLHDFGRLAMEQFLHETFLKAYARSKQAPMALSKAEREVFGADHAFIGGFLADNWKLPLSLKASIAYHHAIEAIPQELIQFKKITSIVSFASALTSYYRIGDNHENVEPAMVGTHPFEISKRDIDAAVAQAKSEVKVTVQEWLK